MGTRVSSSAASSCILILVRFLSLPQYDLGFVAHAVPGSTLAYAVLARIKLIVLLDFGDCFSRLGLF
jgi:hypothetical protein